MGREKQRRRDVTRSKLATEGVPVALSVEDQGRLKKAFALLWVSRNKGPAAKTEAIHSAIDLLRGVRYGEPVFDQDPPDPL